MVPSLEYTTTPYHIRMGKNPCFTVCTMNCTASMQKDCLLIIDFGRIYWMQLPSDMWVYWLPLPSHIINLLCIFIYWTSLSIIFVLNFLLHDKYNNNVTSVTWHVLYINNSLQSKHHSGFLWYYKLHDSISFLILLR